MKRSHVGLCLAFAFLVAVSSGFASGFRNLQNLTNSALATSRGCRDGGFKNKNRVNPSWVSVEPADTAKIIEGTIRFSKITYEDFPNCHESHDWNMMVKLDPQYEFMNTAANDRFTADGKESSSGDIVMETEWETKQLNNEFAPIAGDRVWMIGRWIFDCGHPPYRSEIHPPKGVAFTRQEPYIFRGETLPSNTNLVYVFFNGQGGYYYDHIGGQAYEFDLPMPPRPSATAVPRFEIVKLPFGGPQPSVTLPAPSANTAAAISAQLANPLKFQLFSGRGVPRSAFSGPTARIKYDLTSINDPAKWNQYQVKWALKPPSGPIGPIGPFIPQPPRPQNTPRFGAVIALGWAEPVTTRAYRVLRVTFDSIKIHRDHDPLASGEWKMWLQANGNWFEVKGLGDVDDGDTVQIQKSFLVTVPEDGGLLQVQATGWESDPIDDDFRITNPDSIPLSVADNNDEIGIIQERYTAASNFGIGRYSHLSDQDGPSDTRGDYTLNYRIEEAQRIAAGTPKTPAQPGASTAKRITVTFLSAKILDDADGAFRGDGEIWFDFNVNGLRLRFPQSGTRDIGSGSTVNLNLAARTFPLDLNDTVRILVQGREDDSPTGTDSLGDVGRTYDRTNNFGAGIHTETSNKSDGQFQITYRIDVQ